MADTTSRLLTLEEFFAGCEAQGWTATISTNTGTCDGCKVDLFFDEFITFTSVHDNLRTAATSVFRTALTGISLSYDEYVATIDRGGEDAEAGAEVEA